MYFKYINILYTPQKLNKNHCLLFDTRSGAMLYKSRRAIWQRDNKNSNQSRIEKNTEIIVFEPLRFISLLSAN